MSQIKPKPQPTFFWQGLLILLPVALLAFFGLASLKRDARAAEQEERRRAAQAVQALAQAVRSSVSEDLERYLIAQNEWMLEMYSASQPAIIIKFPDEILKTALAKWEQNYPDLKVADLATPRSSLWTNGLAKDPPDISAAPVPPEWYRELTPRQKDLWQALRDAEAAKLDQPALSRALQSFLDTHPADEARQAADCVANRQDSIASLDNPFPTTE